jgi:Tricorn protease C1 domain/Tricorn protease PDZ domain
MPVPTGKHLGEVAVDHTGRASAVEVRGSVQWVMHAEDPVRVLVADSGVRARLPRLLGEDLVWVSDAEGEDALVVSARDGSARRTLAAGRLGRVVELAAAPDGSRLAVATHDGRVLLVDPVTGADMELARTDNGAGDDLVFSPDSRWLAWAHPGPHSLRQIKLARVADATVVDATTLRFVDFQPTFTLDGAHLAFLSIRTFDPVYDAQVFARRAGTGSRVTVLAENIDDVWASGDGTSLVVRDKQKLRVLPAERPAAKDAERGEESAAFDIDLSRVRMQVEPAAEWRQMFEEAGRVMRDQFWVADMAGNDWPALLARYRPLLERIATRDDLSDLIWEVLRAPGAAVQPGEALIEIDGRTVDPVIGPGPLLVGTAGKPIELRLRAANSDSERSIVVVPVAEEMPLHYHDWVAGRRAAVHAATEGRVGYLHVALEAWYRPPPPPRRPQTTARPTATPPLPPPALNRISGFRRPT